MNIFASPRQSGRTTQAIVWLLEDPKNRVMIVHREEEKRRILRTYDIPESCIWTFHDVEFNQMKMNGISGKKMIMDNADFFFERWMQQHAPGNQWEALIFEDTSDVLLSAEAHAAYRRIQLEEMRKNREPVWLRDMVKERESGLITDESDAQ